MDVRLILTASIVLQLAAAVLALRLIRLTGRRLAWTLIAVAIALMAVRRIITVLGLYWGQPVRAPEVSAEWTALIISAAMLTGLALIIPLFRSIRRSEEALKFTQFAVDHAGDPVFWTTLDARFFYVNEAACRALGYSREELLSMTVHDIDIDFPPARWPETWTTIKQQASSTFESKHRRKDGHVFPVEITANFLAYDGKEYICAFARDITERKQAEDALREAHAGLAQRVKSRTADLRTATDRLETETEQRQRMEAALQESEKRIQAILDNTTAVIYVKDLEGRYLLANQRHAQLFHITPEQVVGKTDYDIHPNETAVAFRANDREVLARNAPVEFEESVPHDDGLHTYISLKFPLFDQSGAPNAVCGISTDITERKRAAEELRQAKEAAERASKAKSTFLANISHEIRTPITALLAAAELLASDDGRSARPDRVDMILRNGRHLLALVEDLLDLARTDADKFDVQCVPCSPVDVLADVRAIVEPLHNQADVEFSIQYDTAVPASIHTDPTRLRQAIINLVSNALKFTKAGHVRVRVAAVKEDPEPRLAIVVEDTGIGIPAGDLEHVFEAFAQSKPATSDVFDGVGLGLPLAKRIAERLGGSLHVKSREHIGTTFILRVATGPLDNVAWIQPHELPAAPAATEGPNLSVLEPCLRGEVLLAEDYRDTRVLIEHALTQCGAKVTAVDNGERAVQAALATAFDLILLDVRMPGMDGRRAVAELRRRGCLVPIIALTASTGLVDRAELLESGFDDLWTKPITLATLVRRAGAYLSTPEETLTTPAQAGSTPKTSREVDNHFSGAVAEFVKTLSARLVDLGQAVEARRLDTAYEILHQLVGAAGLHGFMPLSREAAILMGKAKEGTLGRDPGELRSLQTLVRQAAREARKRPSLSPLPGDDAFAG